MAGIPAPEPPLTAVRPVTEPRIVIASFPPPPSRTRLPDTVPPIVAVSSPEPRSAVRFPPMLAAEATVSASACELPLKVRLPLIVPSTVSVLPALSLAAAA